MPKAITMEQALQVAREAARDMMLAAMNTIVEKTPDPAGNDDLNMILAMAFSFSLEKAGEMDQRILDSVMRSFREESIH